MILLDFITAVADMSHGLFAALRNALRWLSEVDPEFCFSELAGASSEDIVRWLSAIAVKGPAIVRRLYRKCLLQRHVLEMVSHGVQFATPTSSTMVLVSLTHSRVRGARIPSTVIRNCRSTNT